MSSLFTDMRPRLFQFYLWNDNMLITELLSLVSTLSEEQLKCGP